MGKEYLNVFKRLTGEDWNQITDLMCDILAKSSHPFDRDLNWDKLLDDLPAHVLEVLGDSSHLLPDVFFDQSG